MPPDNQYVFIPFAFDTFDFLAPDAVNILKRVQKVMHSDEIMKYLRGLVLPSNKD
jgi:hypothetical protein